ncbi:hypothetical protein [Actinocrispum wychmicini]|uniref:Tox-GHH domain-containing protein n=1 Tax=Actinocrispum wychmicini TaxID=1213861 RepID=A0A4R2JLN9_9PSEU|nr:hypothetical protein [Actinocrispum wychmicini]TCO60983.1 hypothetical protein EV192_103566 [Actinocrispum wychmicini]
MRSERVTSAAEPVQEHDTVGSGTSAGRQGASGHSLLFLQRVAGNQAVSQLLEVQREPTAGGPDQVQTVDPEANAEQSAAEEETFDDQAQQAVEDEQPSVWHDIAEGAAGVAYGSVQSLTPGGFAAPSPAPQSRLFEFFRGAGQMATGVAEMVVGAGGEVGGVALDATGVGAVAGVPLNIASAAVIAQGAVSTAAGAGTLMHAMSMGGGSSSGGGPRLPKKGTPERAAIENARRSGIRAAQRRELDNIKAGGKGTPGNEVWTDAELTKIRDSGEFPKDVRWHHSPTVANRPDLAGDPSVIKPIRGGVQGHLAAHGGDFRK